MISVRFIENFQLTIAITSIDDNGEIVSKTIKQNIIYGDIYSIDDRNVHPNTVDLFFSENNFDGGIAMAVPKNYCEFLLPSVPLSIEESIKQGKSGCGGCGKNR